MENQEFDEQVTIRKIFSW